MKKQSSILDGKTILVTGGTGSFGDTFVRLSLKTRLKKIIVFSRDEYKQFYMRNKIDDDRLHFILGDVRNFYSLKSAFNGVDIVIHAAALKQIPTLEYNPEEAIETNITGTSNLIRAAIECNVSKVIFTSSDKAVKPINLYGATKMVGEKLFVKANLHNNKTKFIIVRYGNILGSRGSIIDKLLKEIDIKKVQITDINMTRFWFTLEGAYGLVMFALENGVGGETFIPKIPSMKIVDMFNVLAPNAEKEVIGIRPGEKLHETLISDHESIRTSELEKYYIIKPEIALSYYLMFNEGKKVPVDFTFSSDNNTEWIDQEKFSEIIYNFKNNYGTK